MKLDKHSNLPLYCQLKDFIIKKIDSGEYTRGGKIPSELELCEELGLSRPTVRQAVAELVFEGKLQIVKGKGTFVSASSERIDINAFNCMTFSFFSNKEINSDEFDSFEIIGEVSSEVKEAFGQLPGNNNGFIRIMKSLKNADVVYAVTLSYIPVSFFPNLISDIENNRSMVDITSNKYAYLPAKGNCSLCVSPADSFVSMTLDVSRGTPVLSSLSTLYSKSTSVTEVVMTYMRSDICKINF